MRTEAEARQQLKRVCAELAAVHAAIKQGADRLDDEDELGAEVARVLPGIEAMSFAQVRDLARRVLEAIPVRSEPATARAAGRKILRRRNL